MFDYMKIIKKSDKLIFINQVSNKSILIVKNGYFHVLP